MIRDAHSMMHARQHRGSDSESGQQTVHFRPRRRRRNGLGNALTLNLAPMIDVVFLLLIFFISTTTFKRAEGLLPSRLPKQGDLSSAIASPITPIVVHLRQIGPGPSDYEISVERFVNTPRTFNELASFLKQVQTQPGFDQDTPVVIQAPDSVAWNHVVNCWNAAVRAGCKSISFGLQDA